MLHISRISMKSNFSNEKKKKKDNDIVNEIYHANQNIGCNSQSECRI